MKQRLRRITAVALAWLVAFAVVDHSTAFEGMRFEAPPPLPGKPDQFSPTTGVRVEVDTRWFGSGGGYLPARVRVEARNPSITERRIGVTLTLSASRGRWSQGIERSSNSVRYELVLPANETAAEKTVLCLVPTGWDSIGQTVEVNDRPDTGLELATRLRMRNPQSGNNSEALRVLRPVMPSDSDRRQSDASFGTSARSWMVLAETTSESFDDWLAYSAVDVIRFNLEELTTLAEDRPERLTAIRRWLVAGGTLWVEKVEAGSDEPMEERTLGEIDKLLGLEGWRFVASESEKNPPIAKASDEPSDKEDELLADEDKAARRSRFVSCGTATPWKYLQAKEASESVVRQAAELLLGNNRLVTLGAGSNSQRWYALRDAGFGRVYAFRKLATRAPKGLSPEVGELTRQSFRERDWTQRHGLELGGKSLAFSNLLIPGVGVAPVGEFQVLITLFVLAIGPLNYWLLWRRQQLQLLVVTAPLGALVVTLGLFAYAAVADGFGVKARARSVTLLDQTSGEAASWSRVTHYAATPPSEPPTFDRDTAIYPITPALEAAIGSTDQNRLIQWTSNQPEAGVNSRGQRLVSGWMPTRTTVQHLIVRSRSTDARLVFADEKDPIAVENRLGAAIDLLLVRDTEGDWHRAEGVAIGGKAELTAATRSDLVSDYRLMVVENEPEFPIGAGKAIEQTLQRLGATSRRRNNRLESIEIDGNLANERLRDLSGLAGGEPLNLPPRSYVAVTSMAVETPLGWDEVDESGSFHVTVGRW